MMESSKAYDRSVIFLPPYCPPQHNLGCFFSGVNTGVLPTAFALISLNLSIFHIFFPDFPPQDIGYPLPPVIVCCTYYNTVIINSSISTVLRIRIQPLRLKPDPDQFRIRPLQGKMAS